MSTIRTLASTTSIAIPLKISQTLKIINTHGAQPVSFWALSASNPAEYLSMSHTHAIIRKLTPSVNDMLYSCLSRPVLKFAEDATRGDHDTLIAACNPTRYQHLGVNGWHASCEENYRIAIEKVGLMEQATRMAPTPLNLFLNVKVEGDGKFAFKHPSSEKGDFVCFEALVDLLVVLSACPMDLMASEEWSPEPREVQYEIVD